MQFFSDINPLFRVLLILYGVIAVILTCRLSKLVLFNVENYCLRLRGPYLAQASHFGHQRFCVRWPLLASALLISRFRGLFPMRRKKNKRRKSWVEKYSRLPAD